MPAKRVTAGFSELCSLLAGELQAAEEFVRLTGAMHDQLLTGEFETMEGLLDERQVFIGRAEELRARADLLYLELRSTLSNEGLTVFSTQKDEVSKLWLAAREQDKAVAEKMHEMLLALRQQLSAVSSTKKGHLAYAATTKPEVAPALDEKL